MKEKIHEYSVKAFFRFDSSLVIEAINEKEAEKIARQTLLKLCKEQLSDKNNINIEFIKEHVITKEEREVLESSGIIEPIKTKSKKNEKGDLDKRTTKKPNTRSKK
jgi:hypothetical protein